MDFEVFHDASLSNAPDYATLSHLNSWQDTTSGASQNLFEQLQSSLELQQQLNIFAAATGKIMPLHSVQLLTAVGEYCVNENNAIGTITTTYQHRSLLMLQQQCLAELVYHSDNPFTPAIRKALAKRESDWLFALRNALVVARLQKMVFKDTLTQLGNRRFFDESLTKAVTVAQRSYQDCALVLLDLDNFKQVNDLYGHHNGDEVLLAVAEAMRDTLRESDQLFRFGGDEFAVILTVKDADSAEYVAGRLIQAINHHHCCQRYQVTASAGIARLSQVTNSQQLFRLADQALYTAKQAGKKQLQTATALS